jgi:hypothetical protein
VVLTYVPPANIATRTPSNVSLSNFNLACSRCTTQQIGAGSWISTFTIDLIITDQMNLAAGMFAGTSPGGVAIPNRRPRECSDGSVAAGPARESGVTTSRRMTPGGHLQGYLGSTEWSKRWVCAPF